MFQRAQKNNQTKSARGRQVMLAAALGAMSMSAAGAQSAMVNINQDIYDEGNYGTSLRPWTDATKTSLANFVITARTGIDEDSPFDASAAGDVGTIYIDDHGSDKWKGLGVQTLDGGGSKGISGKGGDQNEELIFTYDSAVRLDSISVLLGDIDFGDGLDDKDDPVVFLKTAGSGVFNFSINELSMGSAFSHVGDPSDKNGMLDFSAFAALAGLEVDTGIDAFAIRESNYHTYVAGVSSGSPSNAVVPEPASLGMLVVLGGMLMQRPRKRA